jgi:hypothetical protein
MTDHELIDFLWLAAYGLVAFVAGEGHDSRRIAPRRLSSRTARRRRTIELLWHSPPLRRLYPSASASHSTTQTGYSRLRLQPRDRSTDKTGRGPRCPCPQALFAEPLMRAVETNLDPAPTSNDDRVPTSGGETFDAQLEEDEFRMLWLVDRHPRTRERRVWLLLSAALKNGCDIVNATPAERALLEAHGFGSRRIQ